LRSWRQGAVSIAEAPRESTRSRDFNAGGLDRTYTVFGEVFRGMEVVDKIAAAPRDEFDNPLRPIPMTITVKE
jgi:peptidyl-prolyl cis-trans isomerase B (cyclophilin B)